MKIIPTNNKNIEIICRINTNGLILKGKYIRFTMNAAAIGIKIPEQIIDIRVLCLFRTLYERIMKTTTINVCTMKTSIILDQSKV